MREMNIQRLTCGGTSVREYHDGAGRVEWRTVTANRGRWSDENKVKCVPFRGGCLERLH